MPDAQRAARDQQRKSILDFVVQDSKDLIRQVSGNDVRKLDEYFSAIRDIELRIDAAEKFPPLESLIILPQRRYLKISKNMSDS